MLGSGVATWKAGCISMVGPEPEEDVEREALFFAVLRERTRQSVDKGEPKGLAARAGDGEMTALEHAQSEITAWLEEAEEEGASILERARVEAARLRLEAHDLA